MRDNAEHFINHVDILIEEYGLEGIRPTDICDIIDGYKGYAKSSEEELGKTRLPFLRGMHIRRQKLF